MTDPEAIYLQPECCADEAYGRHWCEDAEPDECPDGAKWTKYVRSDIAERAEADVREMVKKAIENRLDGYRELAQRVADAERERDALRVRVTRLEGAIDRLHDFVVSETDYDLHEVTDYVNTVRWREAYAALDKEGK